MKRLPKIAATGLAVLALLIWTPVFGGETRQLIDNFENGLHPGWQEKTFAGRTEYRVVRGEDGHCLQATSAGAASGLIFEKEYRLQDFPLLTWRWKVGNILPLGDATRKAGDDYAARVYVIFPHWIPLKTRSINYIWANRLPQGRHVPNPFSANAVMVAVESGPEKVGRWVAERRNVLADYREIFGEEPPAVGAIALMTDTDNTGGKASACYDDLYLVSDPDR
jgi:hypothetical protein